MSNSEVTLNKWPPGGDAHPPIQIRTLLKTRLTKSVNIYRIARIGQNFDDSPGFQPKTTPT